MDATSLPQYHKMSMDDFKKQAEHDGKWFTNRKLNQIEKYINEPGYSYYGIYDGDRLMCYGGISTEHDNFINKEINPKAAYLFDDYTNPDYRGKGLHRKMIGIREYEARNKKNLSPMPMYCPQTALRQKVTSVADMLPKWNSSTSGQAKANLMI